VKRKIYFTADWHVGHQNVLKFDNRPFKDLDEMHTTLIKTFNHYVPKHGITYFLGDMGLCSNGLLKSVMDQLNGTKVLILGNHDKGINSMYSAGFDVVLYKAELQIAKKRVTLSHCPLRDIKREDTSGMRGSDGTEPWHNHDKHKYKYSWPDEDQFHLHGHIHSPNGGKSKKVVDKQFDVGLPANNYKPVSISEIESFVVKYRELTSD
jgi:calcineurin-like phosphoesterase family protein